MLFSRAFFEQSFIVTPSYTRESKIIGVFGQLLCKVAHRIGQCFCKVSQCLALPLIKVGANEIEQHTTTPAVLHRLVNIEQSFVYIVFHFIHYQAMVSPWDFKYSTNLVE